MIVDFDWKGYIDAYDDKYVAAASDDDDLLNVNDYDKYDWWMSLTETLLDHAE